MIDDKAYFAFLKHPSPETWRAAVESANAMIAIAPDRVDKYSPDQPRDEAGRWTDGDSIAGTAWESRFKSLATTGATAPTWTEASDNRPVEGGWAARMGYAPDQIKRMALTGSAWNQDPESSGGRVLMQAAVEHYGATANAWYRDVMAKVDPTIRQPLTAEDGKNLLDFSQAALRSVMGDRAMGGTVTLYRGYEPGPAGIDAFKEGQTVTLDSNPLSSWTPSREAASEFGSVVFERETPLRDVAGLGGTGLGNSLENEVVVFGRDGQTAKVVSVFR